MHIQPTVNLASPPDRERLVAEVFLNDVQVAEINQESGDLSVEIYPRPDGKPWSMPYEDLLKCLESAKSRLLSGSA